MRNLRSSSSFGSSSSSSPDLSTSSSHSRSTSLESTTTAGIATSTRNSPRRKCRSIQDDFDLATKLTREFSRSSRSTRTSTSKVFTPQPGSQRRKRLLVEIDNSEEDEVETEDESAPSSPVIINLKDPKKTKHDKQVIKSSRTLMSNLPTELMQMIAEYLERDADVISFALVCKATKTAIIDDSVFCIRFKQIFDPINVDSAKKYISDQYRARRIVSNRFISFDKGHQNTHDACLTMLKDLILESNAHFEVDQDGKNRIVGLNHEFLRSYVVDSGEKKGTNIVAAICNTEGLLRTIRSRSSSSRSSLPLIIQLCLLHLMFDHEKHNIRPQRFHESQAQVYKCGQQEPIFKGSNKQGINLTWLLHVAHFFKFHFKTRDEGVCQPHYYRLGRNELPRPWPGKLRHGTQPLGRQWKGAYTSLEIDDLLSIRTGDQDITIIDSTCEDNDGFQDLTFFFDIHDHPELHFPENADRLLESKPKAPIKDPDTGKKGLPECKDFFGLGFAQGQYHLNGRIHALPPQQGIPGFQRVTMMKYLPSHEGVHGPDHTQFWAYEGCVLPGGQIILGRWWSALHPDLEDGGKYSGPFMFWCVDGTQEDKLKTVEEAAKFINDLDEFIF